MNKVRKISKEYADKNTCYANDSNLQYKAIADAVEYGYIQAEKDLELTWQDMEKVFDFCYEVLRDVYLMKFPDDKDEQQDFYEEVLKRFNERKEL